MAVRLPPGLACAGIERDQEGPGFVIPGQEQRVAVDDRRGALTPTQAGVHEAEVALPLELARQVIAIDAARAERDVEIPAICCGRAGRIRVGLLMALVGHLLGGDLLPADLARVAVE